MGRPFKAMGRICTYASYLNACIVMLEKNKGTVMGGEGCENQALRVGSISQSKSTPTAQFRLNSAVAAPYDL